MGKGAQSVKKYKDHALRAEMPLSLQRHKRPAVRTRYPKKDKISFALRRQNGIFVGR